VPFAPGAVDRVERFALDTLRRIDEVPVEGTTIGQLLQRGDEQPLWYTHATENNPFRSPLIARLYALAMIEEALATEQYSLLVFSVSDAVLQTTADRHTLPVETRIVAPRTPPDAERFAIRYLSRAVIGAARLAAARLLTSLLPRVECSRGEAAVFTFFPVWWRVSAGTPTERFFSASSADTLFVAWLVSLRQIWRTRPQHAAALSRARIVALQRFARVSDVVAILSIGRYVRLRQALRRLGRLTRRFGSWEVAPMLRHEITSALSSGDLFENIALARVIRRFAERWSPRVVMFRGEFQPPEQAVEIALRHHTSTVAFIHYPFGRRFLPMRLLPRDGAALQSTAALGRPLPDAFIACGGAGVAHLVADGYPRTRTAECGPQRLPWIVGHAAPTRAAAREATGLATGDRIVFVSLAVVQADSEALFAALADALHQLPPCTLLIRTHPNRPEGDEAVRTALDWFGPSARLVPQNADLPMWIAAADVLVTLGSMIAFEAMVLGVMPVVFENPGTWPENSLAEYEDALFMTSTGAQLASALDAVFRQAPAAQAKRARWSTTLNRVIGDTATPLRTQLTRALAQCGVAADARISA
jgi:hypothetical protein